MFNIFRRAGTFDDGSHIRMTGRDHYSYVSPIGARYELDVYHSKQGADKTNTVVLSGATDANGKPLEPAARDDVIDKFKRYFNKRGESSTFV